MAEQIMWAVKDATGDIRSLADTASSAWRHILSEDMPAIAWCRERDRLVSKGFRCIRVKVVEVEGVA